MKKIRNILAMLMVFVMLVAVMPMNVFAEPTDPPAKTFKVTFELNGKGSIDKTEVEVESGKTVAAPDPAPKAEGFKFEGWFADKELKTAYKFDTAVTQAITLYAKWTPETTEPAKTFKVTFELNGKGSIDKKEVEVESGKTVAAPNPAPKAEGFNFEGWFADKELKTAYNFETPVTQAITLYAKWIKVTPQPKPETKEYTISKAYTNHGSFTVDKKTAKKDETITVNATPNYGYVVDSIYYIDDNNVKHIIKNYSYNDYYYYGYNGSYSAYHISSLHK